MKPNHKSLIIITSVFLGFQIYGQETDTSYRINTGFLSEQLEELTAQYESDLDFTDLTEAYLELLEYPVNINSSDVVKLRDHHLINEQQYRNLEKYKNIYGEILSIYELGYVYGIDRALINRIEPFITIKPDPKKKKPIFRKILKYGRHLLLLRYGRFLEEKVGYKAPVDSAISYPGSTYLGDPNHLYLRYSAKFNSMLKLGFTMEKDPGEFIIKPATNDSMAKLISSKLYSGPDFYSGFILFEDIFIIKKLIIGDYHMETGQGLTLWTGLAFGKSILNPNLQRYARGIASNTSSNENRFFRGLATTIGIRNMDITLYYSNKKSDANLSYNESEIPEITGLQESGYHRTINEIRSRNTLDILSFGGNIRFRNKTFSVGATFTNSRLGFSFGKSTKLYKLYDYYNSKLQNYGLDFSISKKNTILYGEVSYSSNNDMAIIIGLSIYPHDKFSLFIRYHNFGAKYFSLYNNPYSIRSKSTGESCIYLGANLLIGQNFSLSLIAEHAKYQWLRYRLNSPFSSFRDYTAQLNFNPNNAISVFFRYGFTIRQTNSSSENYFITRVEDYHKHQLQLSYSLKVFENLILKNKIVAPIITRPNSDLGYLLFQDVEYSMRKKPLRLVCRLALFSTDSYDSRIYAYENDVLYAYSVPPYYGSGIRYFALLQWKPIPLITFWVRYARTCFSDRNIIGTGSEQINGNSKSDIKIQVRFSF